MINKKYIIIVLIILLLFNLIYFINNNFMNNNTSYLLLNSNNVLKIKESKISNYKVNLSKLNYERAVLYSDKPINGYLVIEDGEEQNNELNFYNNEFEKIDYIPQNIIVVGDYKITNNTNLLTNNIAEKDKNIINRYLNDNNLGNYSDNLQIFKADLGNMILYNIMNIDESNNNNLYDIIFYYYNNEYHDIYVKKGNEIINKFGSISKIIDFDNDGINELLIQLSSYGSSSIFCYNLYKFDSKVNNYIPIINCEEE